MICYSLVAVKNGIEPKSENAGKVSHFNRNKCHGPHMINCFVFSLLKTLSLLFSKPFPPFLFSKLLGFFAHLQNQCQFQVLIPVLNQSGF
jgi:hypothetical protein